MSNLVKMLITTGCNNNRKLLLRLCRNADRVRNLNNIPNKTLNKIIYTRKKEWNGIINIRAYGCQLNNESMLPMDQDNESNESDAITENQHARKFFHSSTHYSKTILLPNRFKVTVTNEEAQQILDTDWSMTELKDLVSAFKKLSYNITNSDTRVDETKYNNIFNTLHTRIPDLSDELLEEVLKCLIPFRKHTKLDLTKTFNLLDKQCEERFAKWPIDKMLLMSDIFYCLRFHRNSNFIWKLMRKMNSKLNKLTAKNLVQLLFLVNVSRKAELNMYEVEIRLEKQIDDLSIHELGIVAMGYFKSKSKIRNSLFLRTIINRLICDLAEVDTITLSSLLKLIRYSMQFNEIVHFRMLLNSITPYVPKLDLMCLTHVAHASAKAGVYEKPLIDSIIERMYNEIKCARIKDIERIAFMLSTFDIDARHHIYDKIVEEVTERVNSDRIKEILKYPYVLPSLLQHLSIKNIYPFHLLQLAMGPSYIEGIHKGNIRKLSYGYSILENSIRIDCPEYTGPFLEKGLLHTLTKLHWISAKVKSSYPITRLFNEVVYILKETIAKDIELYIGIVVPSSLQDCIVIGIDENQNFVSAETILSQLSDFTIKRVDDTFPKNVKWIAFVVLIYSNKIKGTNEPVGIMKAKLRQLERIGYTPILITDDNWLRCRDKEEKAHYLKDLIKSI